jgi:hypothetical protein
VLTRLTEGFGLLANFHGITLLRNLSMHQRIDRYF